MTAPQPIAWPPTLEDLKRDRRISHTDTERDGALVDALDAAIAKVVELRGATVNFTGAPSTLPSPGADLALGTVRLAGRWYDRHRSPDGLINAGDLGSLRVPSYDADIERLLKIGRYGPPVIA